MKNNTELDSTCEEIIMVLEVIYDCLGHVIEQFDADLSDNIEVQQAYQDQNIDAFDELLQQKSRGVFLRMIMMDSKTNKAIGLGLEKVDVFIECTVELINLILIDLYGDAPPITFIIKEEETDKGKFCLYVRSKESLSKFHQMQVIIQQVETKFKEIEEQLLTESLWQLNLDLAGYFHTTVSPAIMHHLLPLYAANKSKNNVELDSLDRVYFDAEKGIDGALLIKSCVFTAESIKQILCEQFGFRNLFMLFSSNESYSELIKFTQIAGHAQSLIKPQRDNTKEGMVIIECIEQVLAILKPWPCARLYCQNKTLGLVNISLQIIMEKFQQLPSISANEALQFKRDIEVIQQKYDSALLGDLDLCQETFFRVMRLCSSLSTISLLSYSDEKIASFADDVQRIKALKGSCFNIHFFFEQFGRLVDHTKVCTSLKKYDRIDSMWLAFNNELHKFLARVIASTVMNMGEDEKTLLNTLSDFMLKILAIEVTSKPRAWQVNTLLMFINNLKMLEIQLSSHESAQFITCFITRMTATSDDFKKACGILGDDLLQCFMNEINNNNKFLLINRAAFAINACFRIKNVTPKKLLEACNFLLGKLTTCQVNAAKVKTIRENLNKLKGILESQAQLKQSSVNDNNIVPNI